MKEGFFIVSSEALAKEDSIPRNFSEGGLYPPKLQRRRIVSTEALAKEDFTPFGELTLEPVRSVHRALLCGLCDHMPVPNKMQGHEGHNEFTKDTIAAFPVYKSMSTGLNKRAA